MPKEKKLVKYYPGAELSSDVYFALPPVIPAPCGAESVAPLATPKVKPNSQCAERSYTLKYWF